MQFFRPFLSVLQRALSGAVLAAALVAPALGQAPPGLTPRVPSLQPPLSEMQARPHEDRIVIQFRDGLRVRAVADGLSGLNAADSAGLDGVLAAFGISPGAMTRLHALPEAVLDQQREEGQRRTGRQLPDLNNYYVIDLPPGVSAAVLADRLSRLPSVQYAAPAPRPAPPPQDISPATPDFSGQQGYRNAAPGGIGLAPLSAVSGVQGGNVQIVDVEYSWQLNHEDLSLPNTVIVNVGAPAQDPFNNTDHGTAVLGQLVGRVNSYGVTGLVPAATARVAAANTTQGYNVAAAITAASAAINAGDIILIEQQTWVCGFPTNDNRYGPSEWDQPVFDAIQTATANGRIVVQAAGNGNVDLDGANCQNRFNRQVRDSGAIIVGAGSAGGRVRMGFSSFGSRVDVQGWGESVTTLGYGDLFNGGNDVRQFYTAQFGGTSSASPIVTAAVAAIQGRLRHCSLPVLNAADMRTLLRDTGSAQNTSTDASQIGPLPNVEAALTQFGLRNDCGGQATTTTLAAPDAAQTGQSVTFQAAVTATNGTPTGRVSFSRNGTAMGIGVLSGGRTQLSATLPAGTFEITARYLGDTGFSPSASAPRRITITQAPPANDNFANRFVLTQPGQVTGSNVGATRETGEPNHLGTVPRQRSVWWTFTPTASGSATVTTCGSAFDTVLGVYSGSQLNALQPVASNDDFCGVQSSVTFDAVGGVAYQVAVAAFGDGEGAIVLNTAYPHSAPIATTTTLDGPTTGQTGQTLTYTATVSAAAGTPGGTVSFRRGGVEFATGTLNGQGVATGGGSFPEGTHPITAHYLGAAGFAPSASAQRSVTVTPGAAGPLEFVGGGTVFEFTAACASGGWPNTPHPARLRYGPGEVNGMPSQVGILFPSGSEHLQTWHALAQSTLNYDALGRQMWTLFVLQQPFPRTTPVQRRITQPANGTDIATATEVMLRLRVSGFGGIPGCGATVAGVVRRAE